MMMTITKMILRKTPTSFVFSLGMEHDGNSNACSASGYIMAASSSTSSGGASTFRSSTCSVNYLTSGNQLKKIKSVYTVINLQWTSDIRTLLGQAFWCPYKRESL
jgi:hypothetical protein